ncbi:hypothetical protein RhiirA4_438699 [Rhizophagus irregularis]|uniref:Uncharacterized protein n=1 Tax=Rhizophagus irregularis TaxID=588596 RepID=A0A2I1FSV8_9GLOM|nr:hypothetical protein RhiirA4_438699 [Rhizophagus irregularis]
MGSEVWQNLHEGIDCPKEFYKKVLDEEVYCHNDRLVKDTSNAQEANQQTCRQCKNRFMREQNYISDYVRDAHQKHEFHKKQIYEHEPKESGEVGSMNKISNNHVHDVHSMNDINGDQVMVHESPHQKQIYEHNFHNQHEPINQTFNLDNTINEAICEKEINAIKNVVHDVQFPNYRFLQSHIYQYKPKDDDEIKWCCEAIQHFSIFIENAFPYLRFHSWSFFKIGFQNGIRKKLAFTFRRRKIYYSRNKFINRRNRRKYRLDHRTNDNNDYK